MRDGKRKIGPSGPGSTEPPQDCPRCPRLAAFRHDNRAQFPDWFNAPVPTFAGKDPRLLIVGLAPGLRGANRTGRPFTGDFAGVLLYETLIASGLAQGSYAQSADDGLTLIGCAITNAVRCVPPQNKPLPVEIAHCRPFLSATIAAYPHLQAILALGRIAHEQVLRTLGLRLADWSFGHGRRHDLPATDDRTALTLFDSYHCSRYNTNTGVLSAEMFKAVIDAACAAIGPQRADAG